MRASSTVLKPKTYKPSSVNVPVLSNTINCTLPLTFTLGGEIQKILCFFSLLIAKTVPTVIAAGRAGGTVIVIRSSDLSTIAAGS